MDIRPEAAQNTGTDKYAIQQAGPQCPMTPVVEVCANTEDC